MIAVVQHDLRQRESTLRAEWWVQRIRTRVVRGSILLHGRAKDREPGFARERRNDFASFHISINSQMWKPGKQRVARGRSAHRYISRLTLADQRPINRVWLGNSTVSSVLPTADRDVSRVVASHCVNSAADMPTAWAELDTGAAVGVSAAGVACCACCVAPRGAIAACCTARAFASTRRTVLPRDAPAVFAAGRVAAAATGLCAGDPRSARDAAASATTAFDARAIATATGSPADPLPATCNARASADAVCATTVPAAFICASAGVARSARTIATSAGRPVETQGDGDEQRGNPEHSQENDRECRRRATRYGTNPHTHGGLVETAHRRRPCIVAEPRACHHRPGPNAFAPVPSTARECRPYLRVESGARPRLPSE
ncbi:hypothetical protein L0Z42_07615 [Burkholderia multivorans]|uniref:hypothetical protein n=1 Tax=Burkholderia multivorans TaxID=87883 RepID=UPI002018A5AF|nr:hypothetical protein [Burkholderia multivorans]MCO1370434.1 hypothetical protein [Burkholderia multivorans]UQO20958.1 hypothetical protein L0Z02_26515 [Burkholderia multivorans]UQO84127.1 hypothetical protein L0Y86_21385 [Burkholderia multivorans]